MFRHSDTGSQATAHSSARAPVNLVLRPLLDLPGGAWCLTAHPTAYEATVTHAPLPRESNHLIGTPQHSTSSPPEPNSHGMRAKGKVRRYARHNRLCKLWTLTYAVEAPSLAAAGSDVQQFMRRLRRRYGAIPVVFVVELGEQKGRLHWHFAADRFLDVDEIRAMWPHGRINVAKLKWLKTQRPWRRLSLYLAKYIAKGFLRLEEGAGRYSREPGAHRYLVSQGFDPPVWRFRFPSEAEALAVMHRVLGQPEHVIHFGDPDVDRVYGHWFAFPDWTWVEAALHKSAGWTYGRAPPIMGA